MIFYVPMMCSTVNESIVRAIVRGSTKGEHWELVHDIANKMQNLFP